MRPSLLLAGLFIFQVVALAATALSSSTSLSASPTPSTIIDILSADVQYSYFVRHIQRLGLVPHVNAMQNVTVFAPINLAFVDSDLARDDNEQSLLRYFADQRFRVGYLDERDTLLDSLYVVKEDDRRNRTFPLKISAYDSPSGGKEYRVNDFAEIIDFDAYSKHQHSFIQTIDHLIPPGFSMCEILMLKDSFIQGHLVSFVQLLFRLVFILDAEAHEAKPSPPPVPRIYCSEFMANVSTVFLPTDAYINSSLLELERDYFLAIYRGLQNLSLRSTKEAAREMSLDIMNLLQSMLLPDLIGGVNGTSGHHHKSSWGLNSYHVALNNETNRLIVNGKLWSDPEATSLVASDGLIHLFDVGEDQPTSFFEVLKAPVPTMIPRKALFAMHFSQLVREFKFRKLGKLIDGTATNQTILIDSSDRDDVSDDDDDVAADSFSSRQQIQYRFMSGAVDVRREVNPDKRIYHTLLDSKLCLKKRIGSCYKVKLSATLNDGGNIEVSFNDDFRADLPIRADGDNFIYVAEQDFAAPTSFKHALVELISDEGTTRHLNHIDINKETCLQSIKYLNHFDLFLLDDNHEGYTVFLPCGNTIWDGDDGSRVQNYGSWKSLGLTLKYLESHPKVFKKVMEGFFLQGLVYSDFGLQDDKELHQKFKTLRGDYVNVSEIYRSGDFNHLISINETAFSVPLNSDILFNQGVVHITSKVLLPSDFRLSLLDLIQATENSRYSEYSFLRLVSEFPHLEKVLQLDDSEHAQYSLLVPSPDLLNSFNITTNYARLWDFLQLHLISNTEAQTLRECFNSHKLYMGRTNSSYIIHTNRTNGVFRCHSNYLSGETYLLLQSSQLSAFGYNADHEVRVSSFGCTLESKNSSCVFLLEKPFSLGWFDAPDNFLHIHIGWISVGIGVIIGVILFGFCTTTVVLCLSLAGKRGKAQPTLRSSESLFAPVEASYMRLTSDDDANSGYYDYGYETDDDMMRNEREQLFPVKGARKKKVNNTYGSMSPIGAPSAPRIIKSQGLMKSLNRDRNLPQLNI